MRDLPGERYWMGSSAAAWWETNDIWHKKWEQQASSKCSYKFPGMIHQGTGIFGGNETLQSHTFTKLYRLMSDGFYKRIKGSPCCSSEIFCPPKRCSRLLHRLLICHLPPSLPKKGLNIFLVSGESSARAAPDPEWLKALVEPQWAPRQRKDSLVFKAAEMQFFLSVYHCEVFQQNIKQLIWTQTLDPCRKSVMVCNTKQNIFTGFWDFSVCKW